MAVQTATFEKTIRTLLDEKKYQTVKDILVTMEPADIAAVFDDFGEERMALLFRLLPKETAAETFAELESEIQETLIRGFSDRELHELVNELYVDDAADLVDEMPANVVKRILAQADPQMRKEINEILRYPENSAGSIMTTEYVSLRPKMTVAEAITRIRRTGVDKETIYTCYVTEGRKLLGAVSVKDLLLAVDDDAPVSSLMDENVISVSTLTDQEEVATMLSKYNFLALPVVDTDGRMVGIVTFDDAMDVLVEETTEDIEKMAGMLPSEKTYLRSTPWDLFKHRIPWLALLMISATFTGLIITNFENALAAQVVLTAFIPMLMDTGGNSGSQASVTIIRALSLGELEFSDAPKVLRRAEGHLERDPHRRALRLRARGAVLRQDHALRPAAARQHGHHAHDRLRGMLHDGADRADRQGRRLLAADGGQEDRLRPGRDGEPLHHDDRGRALAARLLRHRQRPAVLKKEGRSGRSSLFFVTKSLPLRYGRGRLCVL